MCILFIAVNQHPDYPVIICANRDEFHQRPTENMHYWPKHKILAGKDLQAGGTWLGLNATGSFSAVTNFRQLSSFDEKKRSRGDLVLKALQSDELTTQQYLLNTSEQYNDFNLVFGSLSNLQAFDSVNKKIVALNAGFHSVCNGALDDIWPKMALGLNKLAALISANKVDVDALFAVMMNQDIADKQQLPDTGLSLDLESLLSSIFIRSPDYGTRSTTIIRQNTLGEIEVHDRSYNTEGEVDKQNIFQFTPSSLSH